MGSSTEEDQYSKRSKNIQGSIKTKVLPYSRNEHLVCLLTEIYIQVVSGSRSTL